MKSFLGKLVFCAALAAPVAMAAETEDEVSLLFVEMSPNITMADGTLTLTQPDDQIIWFSDRPQRLAGQVSTADFLEAWTNGPDSFQADPPNATLFGKTEGGEMATVVTISNARKTDNGVAFDYVLLEGEEQASWSDAALFIDGACWWTLIPICK